MWPRIATPLCARSDSKGGVLLNVYERVSKLRVTASFTLRGAPTREHNIIHLCCRATTPGNENWPQGATSRIHLHCGTTGELAAGGEFLYTLVLQSYQRPPLGTGQGTYLLVLHGGLCYPTIKSLAPPTKYHVLMHIPNHAMHPWFNHTIYTTVHIPCRVHYIPAYVMIY